MGRFGSRRALGALVRTYLRLGLRGRTLGRWEKRTRTRSIVVALIVYTLLGGALSLPGVLQGVFGLSFLAHSTTLAFLAMILVSETPELLFSRREVDVLGHRPVGAAALILAKGAGFYAFSLMIAGALNAVPALLGSLLRTSRPWFLLVHLTSTAFLALLCTACAVLACAVLLRLVPRERFDAVASWGQMLVLVSFILGNQYLLRLSRVASIENNAWFALFPPAWAASFDALLTGWPSSARVRWMAVAAIVVPMFAAVLAVGRLGSGLTETLDPAHEAPPAPKAVRSAGNADRWAALFGRALGWWVKESAERAVFELAVIYLLRDRRVRLRVVPAVAIAISFPLLAAIWGDHGGSRIYVPMSVAMFGSLSTSLLAAFEIAPEPEAAQIFYIAPVHGRAPLFHGVRKAFFALTTVPLLALDVMLVLALVPDGLEALRTALPLIPLLPAMSMVPGLTGRYLPLSRGPRAGADSAISMLIAFGAMFLALASLGLGWIADSAGWLWPALGVEVSLLAALHPLLRLAVGKRQGGLSAVA